MHHLWLWSGSFAGAPPRPRASEREKENESAREGKTVREAERKVPTEAEGRPTYIRRPIPTQGEEDERRVKPSRVGLGQVYPSSTHTALSCVCHPAEENYTEAEAQPLREKRVAANFRPSRVASQKRSRFFEKRNRRSPSGHPTTDRRWSVPKSVIVRESRQQCARCRTTLRGGWHEGDASIGSVNNHECIHACASDPRSIDPSKREEYKGRRVSRTRLRSPICSSVRVGCWQQTKRRDNFDNEPIYQPNPTIDRISRCPDNR